MPFKNLNSFDDSNDFNRKYYNDRSRGSTTAFELLQKKECNIFEDGPNVNDLDFKYWKNINKLYKNNGATPYLK